MSPRQTHIDRSELTSTDTLEFVNRRWHYCTSINLGQCGFLHARWAPMQAHLTPAQ